jgi:transcriptional regulator with XRE-family HTH domain
MVSTVDIARKGHAAQAIRLAMEKLNMSPAELNEKLGLKRGATVTYGWLAARAVPAPATRKKVAKVLGIPEQDLMLQELETQTAPGQSLVTLPGPRKPGPASDVLAFNVGSDGQARVRLDVVLPFDRAMPLFRLLLDAGVIMQQHARDEVEG